MDKALPGLFFRPRGVRLLRGPNNHQSSAERNGSFTQQTETREKAGSFGRAVTKSAKNTVSFHGPRGNIQIQKPQAPWGRGRRERDREVVAPRAEPVIPFNCRM